MSEKPEFTKDSADLDAVTQSKEPTEGTFFLQQIAPDRRSFTGWDLAHCAPG